MVMLNFFKHLKENNETYLNHIKFAWSVSFYMLVSVCFLLIHGLLPCLPIPKPFTVEDITRKMKKWDAYRKIKKVSRKNK